MLPQGFLDYISEYEELAPLASTLLLPPSVSIRVNNAKRRGPIALQRVPWCDDGYYLGERPQFTFDPALHQGIYYAQDASSMALEAVAKELSLSLGAPVRYLDACAAPGGKTTAALAALPEGSIVVANEYDFKRAEILAENIAKWGNPICVVTRGDTAKMRRLRQFFDIIAIDAPCSGEGMMRKDPQAVAQWSPALVESCAATQREIIANLWDSLRPGGFLIYSTCTFNRSENEENAQWIIDEYGAEPVHISCLECQPEISRGIGTSIPCYRFLPGRTKGEGLFICALRKPGAHSPAPLPIAKKDKEHACAAWLKQPDSWVFKTIGDEIYAWPKGAASAIEEIVKACDAISPGLHVASIKGKDAVPTQELALSTALRADAFPSFETDYRQAVQYLQRQAIEIDAPKGYVLLTYRNAPLGFVKNLGSRANNLYPKNWRILSNAIPDTPPSIL